MILVLENQFTWDGIYGIIDDSGERRYEIDARIEDDEHLIIISEPEGEELGRVIQRKTRRIELFEKKIKLGTITREHDEHDVDFKNWLVSGDVDKWAFRIVDRHGDIAESGVSAGNLAMDVIREDDVVEVAILMMGLAAAVYTEKGGSDVHDFIDKLEDASDAVAGFAHKTLVKLEKLYDVYDEKADAAKQAAPKKEGLDLHGIADAVEDLADSTAEAGHKVKDFIENLYGLNEEQKEDEGRK